RRGGLVPVDADVERGTEAAGVPLHHRSDAELVEALGDDRQTDEPGSVAGHEAHVVGRDFFGRHHEVALVLPVLVIDDDHELAGFDVGDCLWNGGEWHARGSLPAEVSGYVTCDDVGLEVAYAAPTLVAGDRGFERVRDQSDFEGAGRPVHGGHGQAHAIDRDRALQSDEPRYGGGELERHLFAGLCKLDLDDGGGGVDVALDEVAVQR